MQGATANLLAQNQKKIMELWANRAKSEVGSANSVTALTLADSLPLFLNQVEQSLATNRKVDFRSVARHDAESVRIGKLHGADRAGSAAYMLTEVIFEYHILREVIFEVLEEKEPLSKAEHDIILDSIEQAVNDAAVEFTEVHADVQEKFVSTLTHDLRNPLSAVKMNAEIIRRGASDADACLKSAGRIIAGVNRVDSMIRDLLDASRIRAGDALTFEFSECNLEVLIKEVIDEMTVIHGDRFSLHSDAEVKGHFGRDGIRRAIENLIGNAVKYSTPETPITISLKEFKQNIQIIVHNVGNPISEHDQPIIFQQYRRAQSAEKSSKPGWGLGLTLVKGVVDAHKGTVRVESSTATGTSFIVELPKTPQAAAELSATT